MLNISLCCVDRTEIPGLQSFQLKDWIFDPITRLHWILGVDIQNKLFLLQQAVDGSVTSNQISNYHSTGGLINCCLAGDRFLLVDGSGLIGYVAMDTFVFEPVGQIETPLSFSRSKLLWPSPDQECFVLVSDSKMFLMNSFSCEMLQEAVVDQLPSANPHISIGWGTKQTQFHGSEGKEAALRQTSLPVLTSYLPDSNHEVGVCWRSDSKYLALCLVEQIPGQCVSYRAVYMLGRGGELLGKSESDWSMMGTNLIAWKPDSLLVAQISHQVDNNSLCSVVFWERNGLRHGGFTLTTPRSFTKPCYLEWNSDGTILLVGWTDGTAARCLQLYVSNNFHWYLKGEYLYDTCSTFQIHPDNPNVIFRLASSVQDSINSMYVERIVLNKMCYSDPLGNAFVVDGKRLLCTPFQSKNIPPPMYDSVLDDCSFVPSGYFVQNSNRYFWDALGNVITYTVGSDCKHLQLADKKYSAIEYASNGGDSYFVYKTTVVNDDCYTVGYCGINQQIRRNAEILSNSLPKSPITALCFQESTNSLLFQCEDSCLYRLDLLTDVCELVGKMDFCCDQLHWLFPSICNLLLVYSSESCWLAVFALDPFECKLQVFNVNSWCTVELGSFLVASVTSGSELKFFQLQSSSLVEHSSRAVEKGSFIVTAIPTTASLVLGLPRGNLETIVPRPMVLAKIQQELVPQMEWKAAFELCRKHRIDLSTLPLAIGSENFIAQLPAFVAAVNRPDWLNVFISSLPAGLPMLSQLLNQLRQLLVQESAKFFEPILTCFAKQGLFQDALVMIQSNYASTDPIYDKMIKYLLFLQPSDQFLYRVALSMYDWDCAAAIARRSQMDPKEYQEFLHDLSQLPNQNVAKFVANDFLEKWQIALKFLIECTVDESAKTYAIDSKYAPPELLEYVKRHALFKPCLQLLSMHMNQPTDLIERVWQCFAEHLANNNDFLSAAFASRFGSPADSSGFLSILKGSGRMHEYWREVVGASGGSWLDALLNHFKGMLKVGEQNSQLIYHQLLIQKTLLEANFSSDSDDCFVALLEPLCNAYCWSDAFRFSIYSKRCQDLFATCAVNRVASMLQQCQEIDQVFHKRYTRLLEARAAYQRSLEQRSLLDAQAVSGVEIDTLSVVSHMSLLSGTSRASTKSRRKAARAKLRSREGGVYEEDYLLYEIAHCFKKMSQLTGGTGDRSEAFELLESLLFMHRIDLANQLQHALDRTCQLLNDHCGVVFDAPVFPLAEHDPDYVRPWQRPDFLSTGWKFEFVLFDAA